MTGRVRMCLALGAAIAAAVGCQKDPGRVVPSSDVTGKVAFSDGKPAADVVVSFNPQFQGGSPTSGTTDSAGAFTVKIIPGKYAYVFEQKPGKPEAFKAIPEAYRNVSADHIVDVGGGPVALTIAK